MGNNFEENQEGHLFDSIKFNSSTDVRNLIENLSFDQSVYFLNECIKYSYSKGVFSLLESELISKSLYVLNSKVFKTPNDTEN